MIEIKITPRRYAKKHKKANAAYVAIEWTGFVILNVAMSYGVYWLVSSGTLARIVNEL